MRRLNAALDAMGEGMSQAQLDEMTAAMKEDYIEAWDESVWTQRPISWIPTSSPTAFIIYRESSTA